MNTTAWLKRRKKYLISLPLIFFDSFVSCLIYSDKQQEEKADTHRR